MTAAKRPRGAAHDTDPLDLTAVADDDRFVGVLGTGGVPAGELGQRFSRYIAAARDETTGLTTADVRAAYDRQCSVRRRRWVRIFWALIGAALVLSLLRWFGDLPVAADWVLAVAQLCLIVPQFVAFLEWRRLRRERAQ